MSPEAFVFDAYGTLFDVHSVMRRCESFYPGKHVELSRLWRAKQLEYTWQRSLMQRYVPFSTVTREALAYACAALAQLGKKQAILSNGSPDMLFPLVEHSGLKLDAVISVDELKIFKPAPQVYELAVTKLNTEKSRIAFVSSNCWDALGAKSYGFNVYWINRTGAPIDRLGFQPDGVLSSLKDIAQFSK